MGQYLPIDALTANKRSGGPLLIQFISQNKCAGFQRIPIDRGEMLRVQFGCSVVLRGGSGGGAFLCLKNLSNHHKGVTVGDDAMTVYRYREP